jgi:adenine phosphoribosyltransferase
MSIDKIAGSIRDIPDFPKPGIIFKDITPLLHDADILSEVVDTIAEKYKNNKPDYIVGIESRGFIFGTPLALTLGCGFVPIRKGGKLPYDTIKAEYQLEYGKAVMEIHRDALEKGDKVVIIDDLLATGGTVAASIELVKKLGGIVSGIEFVIELAFLNGRKKIPEYKVNSLITV